jgi:hypothetical protein
MKQYLPFFILVLLLSVPALSRAQVNVSTNVIQATVGMVWESHAYVPPLYPGKALYPVGGEVTVLAFPPSGLGSPSALSYTWKKDGEVQGKDSGVGRASFTFSGGQFGESPLIVVEVSNGTKTATGAIRVDQSQPVIRFYKNLPLGGIDFAHALSGTVTTTDTDMTVEAYPFFFSAAHRTDASLPYRWVANGKSLTDATAGTISVQSDTPGAVVLSLALSSLSHILQNASQALTVTFQ